MDINEISLRERYENLKKISKIVSEEILNAEIPITFDEIPTLMKLIELNLNYYQVGNQSKTLNNLSKGIYEE